ncbi:caspase family protein [Methyloferula stellata]|uniref:caspase family protein n=1 Tax=Methyloferula stellata TaxID=876270 RepID=UPI00037E7AA4|nr:caspase family protein [Methyloferula stellata]
MKKRKLLVAIFVTVELSIVSWAAQAQTSEPRLALVIGNAQYAGGPLATASNDAGLIAQTLTTAGFDVTGAADLDQDSVRRAFKEFLAKVQEAGPHAITFVYLAGYGLQYSGENYFVPVDATLQRESDIPIEAIRISDFTHALAGLRLDARVFVLDAARANPFPVKGNPLAGGLALVDVEEGSLDAFNAAPGTIAPSEQGPYGIYARALAEMLRYGGVPLDDVFARVRLRANELSHGAFVPWDVSKLTHPVVLLAASPDAAGLPPTQNYAALQSRPMRDFPNANEAYAAAIEIDTLAAYQGFLQVYPSDPLAFRVRAILAARREALTWNRAVMANTPDAYWSYMRRYPRGPHFFDARRRLIGFSVALEPPPRFDPYDFQGLPPPPDDEYVIVDRPQIIFEGPDYAPAPPPPAYFLAPPPPEFRRLPPPEPHPIGILPGPVALPLPFAQPASRAGSFRQLNGAQGEPEHQPQGAGHPNGQVPNAQVPNAQAPNGAPGPQGEGRPHPGAEPNHALPVPPQGGPGAVAPQVHPEHAAPEPGHQPPGAGQPHPSAEPNHGLPVPAQGGPGAVAPQVHPEHAAPEPGHQPPGAGQPHPSAEPNHGLPVPAQGGPGAVAPQVHPEHAAPQAEPPHPAPHMEPPHAAPHVEPPHAAPPPPHIEPPHPAPPPPAPHVEPPHPAPPPPAAPHPAPPPPAAAAPPHPPVPPHPPKPGEKEEKPGEQH